MQKELRGQLRLPVKSTVFIELVAARTSAGESAQVAVCTTLDISRTGLHVSLEHELVAGAILQIGVDLPGSANTLYLAGEVRWCRPGPGPDARWEAGLALLNDGNSDLANWSALLDALEG